MVQEAEKYRGEDEIQRDCVSAKNGLTSSRQWRMISSRIRLARTITRFWTNVRNALVIRLR
uniref:Uncharacterized protein n=1 Tax=Meloidogyne enterolobii TaxID=390850 RepID=A0A6V7XGU7_MELEN|nr:unnamed protein product [Meloidogyne enterolobii]